MSLLGKILAVLNVLAAIAFVYLAAIDYAKRQHWSYALYRYDLKMDGLPLTEDEKDREGNLVASQLNPTTLQEVFIGAGSPVRSQMEEVQRVRQDLQYKIDNSTPIVVSNPLDLSQKMELKTPLQKLAWALRPLVDLPTRRSGGQIEPHEAMASRRQELTRLMTLPDDQPLIPNGLFTPDVEQELMKLGPVERRQAVVTRLQSDLNQAFEDVNRMGDRAEKRQAVAHLLLGLAELSVDEKTEAGKERSLIDDPNYRRAVMVVGLEAAIREMDSQAKDLEGMAQAVNTAMGYDRNLFVQQHGALALQLLDTADAVNDLKAELERTKLKVSAQEDVVKVRQQEVKQLTQKLADRETESRTALEKQTQLEKALFEMQQKYRDTADHNRRLEQELRTLEKGR